MISCESAVFCGAFDVLAKPARSCYNWCKHRAQDASEGAAPLKLIAENALAETRRIWGVADTAEFTEEYAYFEKLTLKAIELAHSDKADLDAIHILGEGWVGEEALAIALFAALRYEGDLDRVLRCAVNHNGDSDSTGAVAGNITGTQIGFASFPAKYIQSLELTDVFKQVARDMLDAPAALGSDSEFAQKYRIKG